MVDNEIKKQVTFDIGTLISVGQPTTIALIGFIDETLIADYVSQKSILNDPCTIDKFTAEDALSQLQPSQRYDLGIVIGALEFLEINTARQLIAGLRDMHSKRFIVLVPIGSGHPNTKSEWQPTDLLGFGMTLVNRYQDGDKTFHMYKYDITTYKKVPEWLNASRWANPELWNKYRW